MLHRFIFVNFSKGPPATNRESLGGERGEGNEGSLPPSTFGASSCAHPRALPFPPWGRLSENVPLKPAGEKKGEVFTLGLAYPWQPADKDEPTDSRSGRSPTSECEAKNIEARRPQFLHLKMKILLLF
jgi:hypothetical protein